MSVEWKSKKGIVYPFSELSDKYSNPHFHILIYDTFGTLMQVGEKKVKACNLLKSQGICQKKKVWTSICQRGGRGVFLPALSNPSSLTLANC